MARIGGELRSTEFDPILAKTDAALARALTARSRAGKRRQAAALQEDYTRRGFVPLPDAAA